MQISEMLSTLIQLGYVSPRNNQSVSTLGSYQNVPSVTLYGDAAQSVMIDRITNAQLEQYPQRNTLGAGGR